MATQLGPDAQLKTILEHVRSKVECKAKHPYHAVKMINHVVKSKDDLKKALSKFMFSINESGWDLLLKTYPAAPNPKGNVFDFLKLADAVFPPPKVQTVSKHEVFLEGSRVAAQQRGLPFQDKPAQGTVAPTEVKASAPVSEVTQGVQGMTVSEAHPFHNLPPQQTLNGSQELQQSPQATQQVSPSNHKQHKHKHHATDCVDAVPSKYHDHCRSPTTGVIGQLSHRVDHHRDAGPKLHSKKLGASLKAGTAKFSQFPATETRALMTRKATT